MAKKQDLAKVLSKLFERQPRIKGVKREARHTALLPVVQERLIKRAEREHKTLSRVCAEILSSHEGYDAATGEKRGKKK